MYASGERAEEEMAVVMMTTRVTVEKMRMVTMWFEGAAFADRKVKRTGEPRVAFEDSVDAGKQKNFLVRSTHEHRRTRVADKEQTKIMSLFYLAHVWFA